jgi:hypothetical protein
MAPALMRCWIEGGSRARARRAPIPASCETELRLFWIFNKAYGDWKLGLFGLSGRLIPGHQPAGGSICNLPDEDRPDLGFVSASYLIPHLSVWITEASECAKALYIS